MEQFLFFLSAIVALGGAVGVVSLRNPFFNVLALVCHLVALAILFLLLRAQFVAAAQVVVYAGAVMVLYVFVVAYVGGTAQAMRPRDAPGARAVALLFGAALAAELFFAVIGTGLQAMDSRGANLPAGFGTPGQIGRLLLTKFLFPFEAASILLLIAAVGAVVLAKRRGGIHDAEQRLTVRDLLRPAGTGTTAESASGLTGTPVSEPGRDEGAPSKPERERLPVGGGEGGW